LKNEVFITFSIIKRSKGGLSMLRNHYKGSILYAMKSLHPEVPWENYLQKREKHPHKHWKTAENRR
jgi:hypothetical protein